MAVSKPRNRLVIFRLTQEEFQQLETVSTAGGARSLSEFARSKVLNGASGEPSLAELERKLDELTGVVEGLAKILVKSDA
jgi:hypothetical protein